MGKQTFVPADAFLKLQHVDSVDGTRTAMPKDVALHENTTMGGYLIEEQVAFASQKGNEGKYLEQTFVATVFIPDPAKTNSKGPTRRFSGNVAPPSQPQPQPQPEHTVASDDEIPF